MKLASFPPDSGDVGRSRHLGPWALASIMAMLGCPGTNAPDAGADDVPRVSCETPVGGIPLSESVLESTAGYDEELEALDLTQLPTTISLTSVSTDDRSVIAYALGYHPTELPEDLVLSELLDRGPMGKAVTASFAVTDPTGAAGFNRDFFRRGFHRYYACDREFPATLAGFETVYGTIEDLDLLRVDFSIPKGTPRLLFEDRDRHIYAARTELEDGSYRETEIMLADHREDGAIDFLVYGEDGALMDRSEFITITGGEVVSASPFACMSCHVDFNARTYDVVFPTGQ